MKDILRDNEFDGIGDVAKLRAISFVDWLESKDCDYIFSLKGYFDWRNPTIFITTQQVYREYLKYLENETSTVHK